MKNSYKLSIFGDSYSVVSDESEIQLHKAAARVDSLMKEISAKISHIDEKKVAVLVALQMASQILALESLVENTAEYHQVLLDKIERECLALLRR